MLIFIHPEDNVVLLVCVFLLEGVVVVVVLVMAL